MTISEKGTLPSTIALAGRVGHLKWGNVRQSQQPESPQSQSPYLLQWGRLGARDKQGCPLNQQSYDAWVERQVAGTRTRASQVSRNNCLSKAFNLLRPKAPPFGVTRNILR